MAQVLLLHVADQPGSIKKPFTCFFHDISIDRIAAFIFKILISGMCIQHGKPTFTPIANLKLLPLFSGLAV